ncbi:MAG: lipoprotein signal peptidase [Bacteroidales bacterium]|nr:lipoprotein signal peptidase [Bacteroidales bacterium]
MKKSFAIIFLILLIDQLSKVYIKTHFFMGDEIHVFGNWFILHFTENAGMAFGYELDFSWGKIALSSFRIIAIIVLGVYLFTMIQKKASSVLIISLSLIFAGAIGNMIDSAFYGLIFSESNFYEKAILFPPEGGYAGFLYGHVVDMLYFPLFSFDWPEWFPWIGGDQFQFFQPVFNVADSAITGGVSLIIIFQKRVFS